MKAPLICLVTDLRRISPDGFRALCHDAADASIDLIQIREPQLNARELVGMAMVAVHETRGSSTRVVVNGRLDVARAVDADGVHLPASGVPVARARQCGPPDRPRWLVGRSAHNAAELDAAADADYIVFGTVFATDSKPGLAGQGVEALATAVRHAQAPVLAIGGMTPDRIRACAKAGAAGVAGITLFLKDAPGGMSPRDAVRMIREQFASD